MPLAAIVGNPGKGRNCLHRTLTYVPSEDQPGVMLEVCLACGRTQPVAPDDYGVYDAPAKKIVPRGRGKRPLKNGSCGGCPVFNARTGELRTFELDPASAVLAAHYQDNPYAAPATGQLYGHVRAGEWAAKYAEFNGDPMGKNWAKILDTVHFALTDPVQSKKQPHGTGVATLSREAWLTRFAKGKSKGAKDKAWHDLLAFAQGVDQKGYRMLAARRPGWIDLVISNVYDAAWLEQPDTQHQLGHAREQQLLRERYADYELAGKLADREDHWDAQEHDYDPDGNVIPGGSMEAYRSLLEEVRRGEVATQEETGSVSGRRRNPQEQVGPRPKEVEYDMASFRGHPGFSESAAVIDRFHDADPRRLVVFEVPDGKKKKTWEPVHAFLGLATETNYMVPDFMKSSNKHQGANPELYRGHPADDPGLWTHKHYEGKRGGRRVDLPVEVMHPFTNTTRKILRGSVIDGWWES